MAQQMTRQPEAVCNEALACEQPLVSEGEESACDLQATTSPVATTRRVWSARMACGLTVAAFVIVAGTLAIANRFRVPVTSSALAGRQQQLYSANGPTLFCWCVMRMQGYERGILEAQIRRRVGIFECDDQLVFSEAAVRLGNSDFETVSIGSVASTLGGGPGPLSTGSWVNTETFFRAWGELRRSNRVNGYDWIVKVDPDTVLLPNVLKQHLIQHGLGGPVNLYLVNCPQVDNGFYGAVEVMSMPAVSRLMDRYDQCRQTLPYQGWGEDLFSQKCMDSSGVGHQGDFDLVADGNCHGPGNAPVCAPGKPAYHPLKSVDAWMGCFEQAGGGGTMGPARYPRTAPGGFMHKHKFPTELLEPQETAEGGGWFNLGLPTYHRLKKL